MSPGTQFDPEGESRSPERGKPRTRKFGRNPISILTPLPQTRGEMAGSGFKIQWEDHEEGLTVLVRETEGTLIADVFCDDSSQAGQLAVSVALVGTAVGEMIRKTIRLTDAHATRCSGRADFGLLSEAVELLGDRLGVIVFLVLPRAEVKKSIGFVAEFPPVRKRRLAFLGSPAEVPTAPDILSWISPDGGRTAQLDVSGAEKLADDADVLLTFYTPEKHRDAAAPADVWLSGVPGRPVGPGQFAFPLGGLRAGKVRLEVGELKDLWLGQDLSRPETGELEHG